MLHYLCHLCWIPFLHSHLFRRHSQWVELGNSVQRFMAQPFIMRLKRNPYNQEATKLSSIAIMVDSYKKESICLFLFVLSYNYCSIHEKTQSFNPVKCFDYYSDDLRSGLISESTWFNTQNYQVIERNLAVSRQVLIDCKSIKLLLLFGSGIIKELRAMTSYRPEFKRFPIKICL